MGDDKLRLNWCCSKPYGDYSDSSLHEEAIVDMTDADYTLTSDTGDDDDLKMVVDDDPTKGYIYIPGLNVLVHNDTIEILVLFFLSAFFVLGGTIIFAYQESFSTLTALYFVIVSMATVGFGDIAPTTAGGRAVVVFYCVAGVAIVAYFIGAVAGLTKKRMVERLEKMSSAEASSDPFCTIRRYGFFERLKSTHVVKANLNPHFIHRKWFFDLTHYNENKPIVIEVWDWDRLTANDLIGTVTIDTNRLREGSWAVYKYALVAAKPASNEDPVDVSRSRIYVRMFKEGSKLEMQIKLARHLPPMDHPAEILTTKSRAVFQIVTAFIAILTYLVISAVVFYGTEHSGQKWSYFNSLYFCFVSAFGIGYGDYSPQSQAGRGLFIPFLIGAVCISAWVLTVVEGVLMDLSTSSALADAEEAAVTQKPQTFYQRHKRKVKFTVIGLGILCLVFIGSAICKQEDWTWFEGLYFVMITFTTVGYGDFSPKTVGGKLFVMSYTFFGLAAVSMLGSVSSEYETNVDESEQDKENKARTGWRKIINHPILHFFLALSGFIGLNLIGAAVFQALEPTAPSYGNCIYWSVVTLTTIGYGDILPTVWRSRLFTMFYIIIGWSFFLVVISTLRASSTTLLLSQSVNKVKRKIHTAGGSTAYSAAKDGDIKSSTSGSSSNSKSHSKSKSKSKSSGSGSGSAKISAISSLHSGSSSEA